jgi:hypothetical protein
MGPAILSSSEMNEMTWHTSHSDFGCYYKESIHMLDYKTLTPLVTGMTKDLTWTL